jgi:hypothetical protein
MLFSLCTNIEITTSTRIQSAHRFPRPVLARLNISISTTSLIGLEVICSRLIFNKASIASNMSFILVLKIGTKRDAVDVTTETVGPVDEPSTSNWLRRSSRPHKVVKYFEDTYGDLMESVPENTVRATTVSKQATDGDLTEDSARPATNTPHSSSSDYEAAIAEERAMQSATYTLFQLHHSVSFTFQIAESAIRDSVSQSPPHLTHRRSLSEETSASSLDSITDDIVPSATNKYKFTSNSSTGRTAAQMNSLFKPPPRMPQWPLDGASGHAIKLSYTQLGPRPNAGLADELVRQMEMRHALDVERVEDEMEELIETEDEDDG